MMATAGLTAAALSDSLREIAERAPLVQCLTNTVAAQWTANVLLAVGAAPAMIDNPHEAGPFAAIADGVLVNLGTPFDDTGSAMRGAVLSAADNGTPWVLDPVGAGPLAWRTSLAHELLAIASPAVIRGNASEVMALAGGHGGKGVDSVDSPEAATAAATTLASRYATVVAVSGPVDHLTDGRRLVKISNGHRWLTQVTGVGCALGAMIAAFAAVVGDPLVAAASATAVLTVAADEAALHAGGPGSFAVALLDQLAAVTPASLAARVKLQ